MRRLTVSRVATRGALAAALAAGALAGTAAGDPRVAGPSAASARPATPLLTADAQPSWQTNGIVWAMEQVDGVLYVGGNFTAVRPPGAAPGHREVRRKNLAAFDAATGALLPFSHDFTAPVVSFDPATFAPDASCTIDDDEDTYTCDTVYAIERSPDGSRIYVAGDFAFVDGVARRKLAAFATADARRRSNRLDPRFSVVGTDGRIRALAVTATSVYAGGSFTATGSPAVARARLAAFGPDTGALQAWAPRADDAIFAIAVAPDRRRLVIGGAFNAVNGARIHGLSAVSLADARRTPWSRHFVVPAKSTITDLVADRDTVYAAADGRGTFDGRFATDPNTGRVKWVDWCRGSTWALALIGDVLYSGTHAHNCQHKDGTVPGGPAPRPNRYWRLLAESAREARPTVQYWFPSTNGGDPAIPNNRTPFKQGPREMLAVGTTLWVGGQFTLVNGVPQQGLTRFTRTAASFAPRRPERPTLTSPTPGAVTVRWVGTTDLDDETLRYELYRGSALVHSTTRAAKPWDAPAYSFTEKGLAPGSRVSYQVRAVDSRGTRSPLSYAATATVAG